MNNEEPKECICSNAHICTFLTCKFINIHKATAWERHGTCIGVPGGFVYTGKKLEQYMKKHVEVFL